MIAKLKNVFTSKKTLNQFATFALVSTLALSPLAHSEETGLAPPATSDVSNEGAYPEAAPEAPAHDMGGMGSPEAMDSQQAEPAPAERPHRAKKHVKKKKAGKKAKKAGKKSSKKNKKNKKKKKHSEY